MADRAAHWRPLVEAAGLVALMRSRASAHGEVP
jgi:hypothetical protein